MEQSLANPPPQSVGIPDQSFLPLHPLAGPLGVQVFGTLPSLHRDPLQEDTTGDQRWGEARGVVALGPPLKTTEERLFVCLFVWALTTVRQEDRTVTRK